MYWRARPYVGEGGGAVRVNSNVYIESLTKTTSNTYKMMLNVLKAHILVVKAYMHRFTCYLS